MTASLSRILFTFWLMVSLLPLSDVHGVTPALDSASYTGPSWGLGVVVPEGAGMEGGGSLAWENARNVTVTFTLPNIELPSQTVYAVVSLMTGNGTVLQAAAGIYPGNSSWLAYAMYIPDVSAEPQRYDWVANSSAPQGAPGDSEVISIYLSAEGGWAFRVSNPQRNSSLQRSFGLSTSSPARAGDQELFAMESYSWDAATFEEMGSMTLESVFVDGQRVSGGLYSYSDWDLIHSPLFVVGGAAPPQFISMDLNGGSAEWSFGGMWQGNIQASLSPGAVAYVALFLGAALIAVLLSMRYATRNAGGKKADFQNRLK